MSYIHYITISLTYITSNPNTIGPQSMKAWALWIASPTVPQTHRGLTVLRVVVFSIFSGIGTISINNKCCQYSWIAACRPSPKSTTISFRLEYGGFVFRKSSDFHLRMMLHYLQDSDTITPTRSSLTSTDRFRGQPTGLSK